MKTFKLELTGDQISHLQYMFEDLCDERGGYDKLNTTLQDLIDKLYNTK